MKFLHQFLRAALAPACAAGLVAGLAVGWHYVDAGFPALLADAIRWTLWWALAAAVIFGVLYSLLRPLATKWAAPFAVFLPATMAAVPFVAFAGYRFNRAQAILPSELLEPWALWPNLKLLAGCFVIWLAVYLALRRFERTRPQVPLGGSRGGNTVRLWIPAAALLVAVVFQLGLTAFFRGGEKERPDVLVLLVDALRADHLGAYGYGRDTTPAIDSLARDGVVFRQAIAQSTFTKTSIASLFTGRYPYRHGIYWGHRQVEGGLAADLLSEDETTLAEVMREHGYLTAAWVQNSHLRRVMGFAQGFVEYHDQQGAIERIHRGFRRFWNGPGKRYSSFVYLHYIDLHDPYRPPPPYDTRYGTYSDVYRDVDFRRWGNYLAEVRAGERRLSADDVEQLRALYDGQLRAVDEELGRLFDRLRRAGRYDDTLIVLTADHGDAFMEHGFISHSAAPYDELIKVPFIVKLPGGRFAGRTVEEQVRLVDLFPTLLAAVGIENELDVDGCDLIPWMAAGRRPDGAGCPYAVIEIAEPDSETPALAVRTDRHKYIHRPDGEDELYDLTADPGEKHNLAANDAEPASEKLRLLADSLVSLRKMADEQELIDDMTRRQLEALGYIDSDSARK